MATSEEDLSGIPFLTNFSMPSTLKGYQSIIPRFGHTDNLTAVFEGNTDDSSDYAVGLISVGCIILGFFLLWSILLMIFMCVGNKMGFLSGASFLRKPYEAPFYDEDDGTDYNQEEHDPDGGMHPQGSSGYGLSAGTARTQKIPVAGDPWKSKATISRVIFVVSGIICITFGLLMVTHGITNLQTGINTVHDNSIKLNRLSSDARSVIQKGMLDLRDTAVNIRSVVEAELSAEEFCPADPDISNSEVGRSLREKADEVVRLLTDLADFREGELADLDDAMKTLFDGTEEVNKEAGDVDVTDWEALIVLVPYTIFPALLIVAAMMAFYDVGSERYHCFISWFVLPIFILMTIVAYVFAGIMGIMAGVNSDFCLPGGMDSSSPDDHIKSILKIEGYDEESFPYKVANWYIEQCNGIEDPLTDTRLYGPDLRDNRDALLDLRSDLQVSGQIDELAVYCNRDYDKLDVVLGSMENIIEVLMESLKRVLDLAQCGRIIPLYTSTMYDTGCSYSPKAVFWVFSGCLILAFFGMIMITLRSSMKMSVVDQSYVGHFPQGESQSFRHDADEEEEEVQEIEPNPEHLMEEEELEYRDEPEAPPTHVAAYTASPYDSRYPEKNNI
uniref:Protein tweety homolog n=1 Tax=Entomoneis paludosa TaxID=265537 RepID=A0A7S3DVY5_9STRA|mmetsp:Transcript_4195/g.9028  ORF Transcript_4195/g.9028 Transcript_4195/m.9028 type:complete len:615 (+) Transcript_4195:165-2009(+)|eukprot:CAMPEP_0172458740 /NCGR_PEP_ID=MMETSP1065-20121228/29025_1 /TAXON_ID=265537 /ORGANISM="Amphiprora paludosa, Strain CCMP125" /LENGTH=614 /DNA_ID=CAMNT_0013213137 /DNA_START=68 /DNA_END=1912 /DNA_ORIENTATION=-